MFCKTIFGKHDYVTLKKQTMPLTWYNGIWESISALSNITIMQCKNCNKYKGNVVSASGYLKSTLSKKEINELI